MKVNEFIALTQYQRARALESIPRWRVLITSHALGIHNAGSVTGMSKMFTNVDIFGLNPFNIIGIQYVDIDESEEYATLHFTMGYLGAVYGCYLVIKLSDMFPNFKLGDFYKKFSRYKEELDRYAKNADLIEHEFKSLTEIDMNSVNFTLEWDSTLLSQLKSTDPEKLGKCLMESFSDWKQFLLSHIDDMKDIIGKNPIIPDPRTMTDSGELLEHDLSPLNFSTDDFKSIDRVDFLGNGEVSIIFTLTSNTSLIMILKEGDIYPKLKYGDSRKKLYLISELKEYLQSLETITNNLK
jgi:hypothetical protein